jgi:hypothetical protein
MGKVNHKSANIIETNGNRQFFSRSALPQQDRVALLKNTRRAFSVISIMGFLDLA